MLPAANDTRPFILVLAGVNGAGKSSVGGALLEEHGLTWFNPDSYARELIIQLGVRLEEANSRAWQHSRLQLEAALTQGTNYAFETTLGAKTIPDLLAQTVETHQVVMIFCGLSSAEQHIERVRFRVANGGHDIPREQDPRALGWITRKSDQAVATAGAGTGIRHQRASRAGGVNPESRARARND